MIATDDTREPGTYPKDVCTCGCHFHGWIHIAACECRREGSNLVTPETRTEVALMLRVKTAENALRNLVSLKDHKDAHGKTPEYEGAMPIAWADARDALAASTR